MARLSVNLNKIALLRNSRRTGVPDLRKFARLALEAGAKGLTVHPRPDERHIRAADVPMLAELMRPFRPAVEFNIEGYPDERLMAILRDDTAGSSDAGAGCAGRVYLRGRLEARSGPGRAGGGCDRRDEGVGMPGDPVYRPEPL